jgi:hypothetical protein
VFLQDDQSPRNLVMQVPLDPGQSDDKTVTTHGSATFEIWCDGRLVNRAAYPLSSPSQPE